MKEEDVDINIQTQRLENAAQQSPPQTQADNPKDPGYNRNFRKISALILGTIYVEIIPCLISEKNTFDVAKCHYEYQKQMMTLIAIGKKLASMFTSTADAQKMKIFNFMKEQAKKYDFGKCF